MDKKILVYTFYNHWHITYKILQNIDLPNVEKYYLGSLRKLTNLVNTNAYDYVLGMGNFRKDGKYIRIEEKFKNKYGKRQVSETGPESYDTTWNLSSTGVTSHSDNASRGPCNRSACEICRTITENKLVTKFAFVHIPKGFDEKNAYETITWWLTTISQDS